MPWGHALLSLAVLAHTAGECADNDQNCAAWAAAGECAKNSGFMHVTCAASCDTCDYAAEHAKLAPASYSCEDIGEDTLSAGGISARMQAMRNMSEYSPRFLSEEPYVLLLDTFIDAEFAKEVIRVGGHDFQRSLAGFSDGVVSSRTSSTSWCNVPTCERDEVMLRLKERITRALDVPMLNTEHLQLLRYEPGQFYKHHHDQNSPVDCPAGPRVWTFFLYLSEVEEGGDTYFPHLDLSVRPKAGAALVWPSVRDESVFADDLRTEHEARPVLKGTKYAANFWVHLRNFQTPHAMRCGTDVVQSATARRKAIEEARVANGGHPDNLLNAAIQGVRPNDPRLQPYKAKAAAKEEL